MWLILSVLTKRLIQYFQGARGPDGEPSADFEIQLGQPLPLELYFGAIDNHLAMRHQVAALQKMLEDRSHQFRSVQKRLLVKFKERNPAELNHLESLLAGTYQQLNVVSGQLLEAQTALKQAANMLSCATKVILMMLQFQHQLSDDAYDVLSAYLSPVVHDTDGQGWEEVTDCSLTSMVSLALSISTGLCMHTHIAHKSIRRPRRTHTDGCTDLCFSDIRSCICICHTRCFATARTVPDWLAVATHSCARL